jgi:hypothetical protein
MSNNEKGKDKGKFVSMYGGRMGYTKTDREVAFSALNNAVRENPGEFWAFMDTVNVGDCDEEVQTLLAQLEITAAKAVDD